jgi:peptidoglycan/xylan/chitin deacetylase (PgdA/CDA1 family)
MSRQFGKNIVRSVIGKYYHLRSSQLTKQALTVFCYHEVSVKPSEFSQRYGLNVSPQVFDFQISFIKMNFNIITPDDLLENRLPENAALITFDDGFLSFFEGAIPILEKYQVPAMIFLNMEPIRGGVFWSGLITYLCEKEPEFIKYLEGKLGDDRSGALFLSCSREIVTEYLERVNKDFATEVVAYIGEFAKEQQLEIAAKNRLIFFGNHLYNHYVPRLMSDEELVDCFEQNVTFLKRYQNYRNLFSFPFGQPNSCFLEEQVDLLQEKCTKIIFSSSGRINYSLGTPLDRVALTSIHCTPAKFWFGVFLHRLKDRLQGRNCYRQ